MENQSMDELQAERALNSVLRQASAEKPLDDHVNDIEDDDKGQKPNASLLADSKCSLHSNNILSISTATRNVTHHIANNHVEIFDRDAAHPTANKLRLQAQSSIPSIPEQDASGAARRLTGTRRMMMTASDQKKAGPRPSSSFKYLARDKGYKGSQPEFSRNLNANEGKADALDSFDLEAKPVK